MSPSTRRRTGRPPSDATNRGKARDPAATCFVNWCAANVQRSTTRARRIPTAADTGPEPPSPPPPSPPSGYHPDIAALVAYWHSIHPPQGLPGRRHFDPVDVPWLLPHIWLLDVFRDPWRFRMRLVGTGIVAHAGRDSTGRWLDDAFPNLRQTDAHLVIVHCPEHGVPVSRAAPLPIKAAIRPSPQEH